MSTVRQNKVASLVQKEVADIFQKEMRNAFGSGLITVTHVFMSPDLSFAKTYLSIFGSKNKEETLETVRKQAREIRRHLGERVRKQLRIVPEIAFFTDESAEYADKMEQLFMKIATETKEIPVEPKSKKKKK
jgi:ribosome-binding factor A